MRPELLAYLQCPACGLALRAASGANDAGEVWEGALACEGCSATVPVVRGIPRFVPSDSYVSSFSFEWTRFARTQLDSARGWRESERRLQESLDFPLDRLKGKVVLDAGCGVGRFAEVALNYGATVVAVDLSYAVESAARNLAAHDRAHVLQADLRRLPLRPEAFDLIYCLGVLHHTPAPRATFEALLPFLRPGGKISVTLYSAYNKVYVASTNFWRRLTTRLPVRLVYYLSHLAIPLHHLYKIPVLGLVGRALWPISRHPDPEWRLLDTLDCYTPRYQFFYTHSEVFRWLRESGLTDVTVLEPAVSFIATRPPATTNGDAPRDVVAPEHP